MEISWIKMIKMMMNDADAYTSDGTSGEEEEALNRLMMMTDLWQLMTLIWFSCRWCQWVLLMKLDAHCTWGHSLWWLMIDYHHHYQSSTWSWFQSSSSSCICTVIFNHRHYSIFIDYWSSPRVIIIVIRLSGIIQPDCYHLHHLHYHLLPLRYRHLLIS